MIRLGDLFEFKNGRSFSKTEWKESGLPIIRIQNLNDNGAGFNYFNGDYDNSIEVNAGDLLFSWSGTVGSSFGPHLWARDKGVLNQHIYKVSFKTDMVLKYAYYALLFLTEEIERSVVGAVGLVHVTKKSLNEFKIPVPAFSEQKRIVAILDQAFADIEQARAKTEQNLKNARELFESYLQQVFSERGEGWVTWKLKAITSKIGSGATPRGGRESYQHEGTSLIRSMNVHDRFFKKKDLAFIDDQQADKLGNVIVETGDVLLNITGASVARCCVVPDDILPARVNQHVAIIRVDQLILTSNFLTFILTSKFYKDQLLGIGEAGSTRQAITKTQIEEFEIHFPRCIKEQNKLLTGLHILETKTNSVLCVYKNKLLALDELKKSILQKAFTGQLTNKKSKGVAA